MGTKITDNYFEYSTVKYFRGKAENIQMASYGDKEDPVGPQAHLEVYDTVNGDYLDNRVQFITTTAIDWSQATKADVEVNGLLKYFGLNGKAALSASYEKAKTDKLKLAKFAIAQGDLKSLLNGEADGARNYLADEGSDGRIVSEIWVVMDAKLSEHFSTYASGSASVKANGKSLDFTVSGGTNGSQTITLAKGTTFAYLLYKVKNWTDHKTHVDKLEADYKGMN